MSATSAHSPLITEPSSTANRPSAARFVLGVIFHLQKRYDSNWTTRLTSSGFRTPLQRHLFHLSRPPLPLPTKMDPPSKPTLNDFQELLGLPLEVLRLLVSHYDDIPGNPILAGLALVGGDVADVTRPLTKDEIVSAHECVSRIDKPE